MAHNSKNRNAWYVDKSTKLMKKRLGKFQPDVLDPENTLHTGEIVFMWNENGKYVYSETQPTLERLTQAKRAASEARKKDTTNIQPTAALDIIMMVRNNPQADEDTLRMLISHKYKIGRNYEGYYKSS